MSRSDPTRLLPLFRRIVAWRWGFIAVYALLFPFALLLALRVGSDNTIARLIVQSDADYLANQAFQKIFPEGEHVVLLAEAEDPFDPGVLEKVSDIEKRLSSVPRVESFSALALYRRAHPTGRAIREEADEFRRFASGTDLFRQEGLVGKDFLSIPVELKVSDASQRNNTLAD